MDIVLDLVRILIFPGLLFAVLLSLFLEWLDRKVYARMQNRVGPPLRQPLWDLFKLLAKEDIVPEKADPFMFTVLPVLTLAAAATAMLYIPIWGPESAYPFWGDLLVIIFLLTVPTMVLFLAGWFSANPFGAVGSFRTVIQFLSYEVPLLLAVLTPAVLAGSWSISDIVRFQQTHPWAMAAQLAALGVGLLALQGKLERVPFDAPEAETEIVAGPITEYTGRRLALFRLSTDVQMLVGAALFSNIFLAGVGGPWYLAILLFLAKIIFLVGVLAALRAMVARIRIEQMRAFSWKYLVPIAVAQMAVIVLIKVGVGV